MAEWDRGDPFRAETYEDDYYEDEPYEGEGEEDEYQTDEEWEAEQIRAEYEQAWAEERARAEAEDPPLPEEPEPELPVPSPGPVPIRPENWDLASEPPRYKVAWGDTLWGLAATYLDSGPRWPEIWALQPQSYKDSGRSPDDIYVGDWLAMPEEAAAKVRRPGLSSGWKLGLAIAAIALAAAGAGYVFSRPS